MSVLDDMHARRKADHQQIESWQACELAELNAGTEAINRGTRNPVLWALVIGGIVAAPFTWGLSLIVSFVAGVAMNGGPKHMVASAMPMTVDLVSPKAGFVRIVASILNIILALVAAVVIASIIAFALGVQP